MKLRLLSVVALSVLLLALFFFGRDLWVICTTYRAYYYEPGHGRAGWVTLQRWSDAGEADGPIRMWHTSNGVIALDGTNDYEGIDTRTFFDESGQITEQHQSNVEAPKTSPPWWFDAVDQPVPSAPWLRDGSAFEAWWEAVEPKA